MANGEQRENRREERAEWQGCTPEIMRAHEEMMITTQATLKAFMERYENDRHECSQRYADDRDAARAWRGEINKKLDDIGGFLSEFKPNYKRIMGFTGVVILGSIGIVFKIIWDHVTGH